jgi:hypothetical protein
MDIGVSAMMTEMGYPGLARLIGPESTGHQIIVSNMQVAARQRAAADMWAAMMKGDVEGVLAGLLLLGVRVPSTRASKFLQVKNLGTSGD